MAKVKRTNLFEIKVPFRDIDMNGRMFLTAYISYAEAALAQFWTTRPILDGEPVYGVSRVSLNLKKPLAYEDVVRFLPSVDKIGVHSAGFMIVAECRNEPVADIEIIWQARDPTDGTLMPLPEETRDWLYGFLD